NKHSGIPPLNNEVDANEATLVAPTGAAMTPDSGEALESGSNELLVSHAVKARMRAATAGARKRAILRDNLKLWVISGLTLFLVELEGVHLPAAGEGPAPGSAGAVAHRTWFPDTGGQGRLSARS